MNKEIFAKVVGATIGLYPEEIKKMLISNGVIINTNGLTVKELVDSTIAGLSSSVKFYNDFEAFFNANEEKILLNIKN